MSLPTLNNSPDFRAPTNSDNAAHDRVPQTHTQARQQPQPAPDQNSIPPTMNNTCPRFASLDEHWASLPASGHTLSSVPSPSPTPLVNLATTHNTAPFATSRARQVPLNSSMLTLQTDDSLARKLAMAKQWLQAFGESLEHMAPELSSASSRGSNKADKVSGTTVAAPKRAPVTRKHDTTKERYQLARAIEANDRDAVTRIVESHPSLLRKRSADGRTPLGHAASNGSVLMVSHLILLESRLVSRGTDKESCLTLRDSNGKAPIHHAIDAGHWQVFELLLEAGTPLDVRTGGDHIPLLPYATTQNSSTVARLLQCLPTAMLDRADDLGQTAVHMACIHDDPETLGLLLKAGCHPFLPDKSQMTSLHLAAKKTNTTCLSLLLPAASPTDIDAATCLGNTPLHFAATAGRVDAARLLLKRGASIDFLNQDGWTPLAYATDEGHLEMMTYLVKHRARIMPGEKFWAWPITRAVKSGNVKGVEILRMGKDRHQLQFNAIRIASNAAKFGNAVMFDTCLKGHILKEERVSTYNVAGLLDAAVNGGSPEVVALMADFLKKAFFGFFLNDVLARAFVTAQEKGQYDCLLPLATRLKHLPLSGDTLKDIVAGAQARKDYLLLDALAKIKIVVDGDKLTSLPDELLPDPLARELLTPVKTPRRSLARAFRKTKLPLDADIDATNTASQLALDVTSIAPSAAIAATLTAQKISALLHQPVANSLIPLCTAFASAGNLNLSQAQYIMGYGLAKYADPDHLPLPANLDKLSSAQAMLDKCHAHREALAEAGLTMLEMADDRINDEFIHALALIAIATPAATGSGTAIADKLATDFGLMPIWATRLATVCNRASASVIPAYSGSFNTDQPPVDLMAKLESSILQHFADEMKLRTAPEGFRDASLAIGPGVFTDFNELLWRQWDKICEVMADSATDTGASVSVELTADQISDEDSDVLVSSSSE